MTKTAKTKTVDFPVTVKCDEPGCGWKQENESARAWYHKRCPACGRGVIVDNIDMALYLFICFLYWIGVVEKPDGEHRQGYRRVKIDTAEIKRAQ